MTQQSEALQEAIGSAERALAGAEWAASLPADHLRILVDAARRWPFGTADVSWLEHRIRELEQKIEACAVGAPMRAAFQEEIARWRDLRDRIAGRLLPAPQSQRSR
jgi:hypothetical protein